MSLKSQTRRLLIVPAMLGLGLGGTILAAQERPTKSKPAADKSAATPSDQAAREYGVERMNDRLKKQIDMLENQREGLRSDRGQYSDRIIAICGLSPENVKPVMLDLERELFMLNLGAETKRVRLKLLEKRVAEAAARTQEVAAHDPIAAELDKIVAARTEATRILRAQREAATVPTTEAIKAEAELAEAEVRLAMRKQEVAKPEGDGERVSLVREVRALSMETALDEVRSKELESRLGKLRDARGMVDRFNDASDRISALEREIERGRTLLMQVELSAPGA